MLDAQYPRFTDIPDIHWWGACAQGVLETANSIFKRFRNTFMSQSVNEDLKHSQQFVVPLLATLQVLGQPAVLHMKTNWRALMWDMSSLDPLCFI